MRILTFAVVALLASASAAMAESTTWTGASDTSWNTADNWGGAVPGSSDTAVFSGVPTANQPELLSSWSVGSLNFESAGWTVSAADDATLTLASIAAITSAGAGVNVVDANFADQYVDGMTFRAEAGNTLVMNGDYFPRRAYAAAGPGMIVFNGASSSTSMTWTLGEGTVLFNTTATAGLGRDSTLAAGGVLGGTTPVFRMTSYSSMTLADGAHFSPGGDGVYGEKISTVRLESSSSTVRAYFNMGGAESKLIMDLGELEGENDQILVDLSASNGYFRLNDCELALRGPATLADGDYTLVQELSGNYNGSFSAITYNDMVVDPEHFALTYNDDSVVLTVTDVPEPASLALLALGAAALTRRRRA